ncbi:MAG: hypothetical protein ACREIT_10585, partial [Tepidisphaeraceae bacterium]
MGKDTEPPLDVFVLGDHPAAYLAAALLRHNASKLRVLHAIIPDEPDADRLVFINPELFTLSKLLEPLRRKLDLTGIYGLQFLADDGSTRSEHRGKAILSFVASYADFRAATFKIAHGEGVEFVEPRVLQVQRLDEAGLEVLVNKTVLRPRMMIVSGKLPDAQQKLLGL